MTSFSIGNFFKMESRSVAQELEAKLKPAHPFTHGSGKMERKVYGDGNESIKVAFRDLSLPDSVMLDVAIAGHVVGQMEVNGGRGRARLESRDGEFIPPANIGDPVEIAQDGLPLLSGTLVYD